MVSGKDTEEAKKQIKANMTAIVTLSRIGGIVGNGG